MDIQDLQTKIASFKEKGSELLEQFPDLKEVSWQIEEIPYRLFKEYMNTYFPSSEPTETCGKLFFIAQYAYGYGIQITLFSMPVKIKRIIEVEETENIEL